MASYECSSCGYTMSSNEKNCKYCGSNNPIFVAPPVDHTKKTVKVVSEQEKARILLNIHQQELNVKKSEKRLISYIVVFALAIMFANINIAAISVMCIFLIMIFLVLIIIEAIKYQKEKQKLNSAREGKPIK